MNSLQEIKSTLSKHKEHLYTDYPIKSMAIFGSYSRNEETNDSDIDLLVKFLPDNKITLFYYLNLIHELSNLTGKQVDLVEEGQLKNFAKDSFNKDKILIYERKTKR